MPPPQDPVDLAELDPAELASLLEGMGAPLFHARQLFAWIHRRAIDRFEAMTDLPRALREELARSCVVSAPRVLERTASNDGTTKLRMALSDGRQIEAVYIPDTPAQTLCISTQVGCAMRCTFCLTGRMGLSRHLSAGEIAGQVRVLARELDLLSTPFNIVLMGMGEPLHNYDETMKALRLLRAVEGLAIPPRRVTLSTVGVLPALARLGQEPDRPNLAISLHATTDALRSELVPPNRRYPLADLLEVCRGIPLRPRERLTFEYVLLAGVNDSSQQARQLARLLHGLKAKVNLLPLNEAPGIPYSRPTDAKVEAFARTLAQRHIVVSVRKSRGRDIRAACGQLIVEGARPSTGQRAARLLDNAPRAGHPLSDDLGSTSTVRGGRGPRRANAPARAAAGWTRPPDGSPPHSRLTEDQHRSGARAGKRAPARRGR